MHICIYIYTSVHLHLSIDYLLLSFHYSFYLLTSFLLLYVDVWTFVYGYFHFRFPTVIFPIQGLSDSNGDNVDVLVFSTLRVGVGGKGVSCIA